MIESPSLRQYVETLFGGEDPLLASLREEASREGLPSIQVPFELGRLLQLLIVQTGARRVLEIGTLFGYSAILMARALPADGRLLTLELDPRHAEIARRNLDRAGVGGKVEVRQGPALDSLSGLRGEQFDLVFIDADKPGYPDYLRFALDLTRPGSVIVADNVWRGGGVTRPDDEATEAMARFNQALAHDERLLSTIVPTRDCSDAASLSVVRST